MLSINGKLKFIWRKIKMARRGEVEPESYRNVFKKKFNEAEREMNVKRIPFCSKCAHDEFFKATGNIIRDIELKEGITLSGNDEDEAPELIKLAKEFDFSKFGGFDKFKEIHLSPIRKKSELTGKSTEIIDAYHIDFLCNVGKHGNTIMIYAGDYDDWRKMMNKKSVT